MTGERNPVLRSDSKAELLKKYVTITTETTATVQSQSDDKIYHIDLVEQTCECPDFKFRGNYCKHLQAVDLVLLDRKKEEKSNGK